VRRLRPTTGDHLTRLRRLLQATRLVEVRALALIIGITAWTSRGLLTVVSWPNDLGLHDAMVQWATGRMARGHLPFDGWMPTLSGGLAQFHHYQSLPHVVTAVAGLAIGPQRALHLTLWLAVATWPLTVYLGGRAIGQGRRAALFAAACAPLLRSAGGYGFEPFSSLWLGNGLWSQAWGMWVAPLAIGWTVRTVRTGERPVRAAAAVALTICFHLPTAWFTLVFLALASFLHRSRWRASLVRTARVIGAALLASAWFLVPFLLDRSAENRSTFGRGGVFEDSYGWRTVVGWVGGGDLVDAGRLPVLSLLALVGIGAAVRQIHSDDGSRELLALGLGSLVLLCGRHPFGPLIDLLPASGSVFLHRAIAMVHLSAVWLIGAGAAWLVQAVERRIPDAEHRPRARALRLGASLAVLLLFVPAMRSTSRLFADDRSWIADQRRADATDGHDMSRLVDVAVRRGGGRVYAGPLSGDRTVMVGQVPGAIWLAHHGVEAMGYPLRVSALFADIEALIRPTSVADLEAAGVRWLLQPAAQPPAPGTRFVAQRGSIQLWEVPGPGIAFVADLEVPARDVATDQIAVSILAAMRSLDPDAHAVRAVSFAGRPQPDPSGWGGRSSSSPGRVEGGDIDLADGRADLTVRADRQAVVVLQANWDPRWRATVDGRPVTPIAVTPTWVAVPVPAGRHQVLLRYGSWPWALPMLVLGWLALVLVARRPSGRRTPSRWRRLPLAAREAHH
jgi:hypothetical protein